MDLIRLLRKFTEAPGPSGYEQEIASTIKDVWEPLTDETYVDHLGSVVAVKRGGGAEPRQKLMLAAHLDEIGLMVKQIVEHEGYGFLRLTKIGGVDIRHLYGQRVLVHGRREIKGVIGSLPGHMLPAEKRNKPYGFEELLVDLGMTSTKVNELVSVGDFITFRQPLRKMLGKSVTGKALDNRASVTAVTVCLDYLAGRQHEWDVIAVATSQEETAYLGAYTSTFTLKPDAAVAIDVTFGKGAGANDANTFSLGSGPVLDLGPNVHPGMQNALRETAGALEMKISTGIHSRASGTDAFAIQVSRAGVPTGLVAIPLRYMHTMVETVNTDDIKRTGRLLGEFIARLDNDFLDELAETMMEN